MKKGIIVLSILISMLLTGCSITNVFDGILEVDILGFLNLKPPEIVFEDDIPEDINIAPGYLTAEGVLVYEEEEIEETDIIVEINGEKLQYDEKYNQGISGDVKVLMFRDRSLVPLRELANTLGYEIYWEGAGQKQELFIKGTSHEEKSVTIVTKLNSNEFDINIDGVKQSVYSETPTIKYSGKIYVPIRFVGETLGLEVIWVGAENRVEFNTK